MTLIYVRSASGVMERSHTITTYCSGGMTSPHQPQCLSSFNASRFLAFATKQCDAYGYSTSCAPGILFIQIISKGVSFFGRFKTYPKGKDPYWQNCEAKACLMKKICALRWNAKSTEWGTPHTSVKKHVFCMGPVLQTCHGERQVVWKRIPARCNNNSIGSFDHRETLFNKEICLTLWPYTYGSRCKY